MLKKIISKNSLILVLILVVALGLRLYKVTTPLADWHSFRQADTASVAWEYYREGAIDLLRPQYQDLGNIQSGMDNPEGWRMVEMPLVNGLVAGIMLITGSDEVVLIYRLVDIGLSLLAIAGLYWLVWKFSKKTWLSALAAFLLAVLPYSVYYSRTILPEVALLAGQIWTLNFFYNYLDDNRQKWRWLNYVLTGLTLAVTLLVKPVAVFLAPVLIYMAIMKYKNQVFAQWQLYLLALLAILPLLWWREWILQFPAGIPASNWLLQGQVKALSLAWWRWLGWERLVKLIFGFWGMAVIVLGICKKSDRRGLTAFDGFVMTYVLSMILFLLVFASGNVQHDYYQVFILPAFVIALAKGLDWLWQRIEWQKVIDKTGILLGIITLIKLALLTGLLYYSGIYQAEQTANGWIFFWIVIMLIVVISVGWRVESWQPIKKFKPYMATWGSIFLILGIITNYVFLWQRVSGYYQINHPEIVMAGETFQKIINDDQALVIAPYQTDTTFLFQTKHRGWSIGFAIDDKIAKGADYYISTNYDDESNDLLEKYEMVYGDENFMIIDLRVEKSKNDVNN